MKINNVDINQMSKKQIHDIYLKASFGEIDEQELIRIREALYELNPLCQFTKDEYVSLIETLDLLSDEALQNIQRGFFSLFYKKSLKYTAGMPEDFDVCDSLVNAIYTNYKGIKSFESYLFMCDEMGSLEYFIHTSDEEIMKYFSMMNPELGELLKAMGKSERERIIQKLKERKLGARMAYSKIKWQLLTTYMMFLDEFKDSYGIVPESLELLLDKLSDEQLEKLSSGMRIKESNVFYAFNILEYSYYKAKDNNDSFGMSFVPIDED
jgi:hypothetical protein